MTTGDDLLYRSTVKGTADRQSAQLVVINCLRFSRVSCLLQSTPCCPPNGTWCFKWIKLFICHMLFSGLQLKGLICLSTKKKKKLCGRGGGGHVFEFRAFFLWVRNPHSRKKKKTKTLTSVIQTRLVEPKIKPTLMKAGVLQDIILDLILRL